MSRSGYYDWLNRKPSKRTRKNQQLKKHIARIYWKAKGTYGSPRIHRQLAKEGVHVNVKRVARLMRVLGLKAIKKRKFKVTTDSDHNHNIQDDLVKREFDVEKKNRVWTSDITYIRTKEGWLYLAKVIDLYSRKVVGWSMKKRITKELVIDAFMMAENNRNIGKDLIFHSDRGSQYASHEFQKLLKKHNVQSSMARKGDCWDNAVSESFIGTLKTELTYHCQYETREIARRDIFHYIEVFYNRYRLHSSLDYQSPEEYEQNGENQSNVSKLSV